ncbi:unnamed protein product [Trichogramma brassicae]|uniref:Chromo domain-containing protein n=1 Tax=Trichogramma brassicae TaxID=86971 RepID=A0A6H5IZW9_9HYME|nr:unnamed protein product [Trichogramma brassicae]
MYQRGIFNTGEKLRLIGDIILAQNRQRIESLAEMMNAYRLLGAGGCRNQRMLPSLNLIPPITKKKKKKKRRRQPGDQPSSKIRIGPQGAVYLMTNQCSRTIECVLLFLSWKKNRISSNSGFFFFFTDVSDGTSQSTDIFANLVFQTGRGAESASSRFVVVREAARYYKRFRLRGTQLTIRFVQPPAGRNWLLHMEESFEELHAHLSSLVAPNDYIGVTISSDSLTNGNLWLSFRPIRDFTVQDLWTVFFNAAQSNDNFSTENTLESVERLGCGSDVVNVKQKKSVQTPGTPLERLDAEMNEILLAPCSDERAKWNLYNNVLQRYLQLKKTSQHIPEKPKTEEQTDASDTSKNEATATSSAPIKSVDAFIVESVPAKYRHNAKNLVEWLRKDGSVEWSENGSVSIDGSSIAGNIIDFVNDTMRSRTGSPPCGIIQFIEALRKASVPREFIGNKQYRRFVVSQPQISEDDSPAESTTSPNSSPRSHGRLPVLLQTDKGKEFVSRETLTLFKKNNIQHRVVRNPDIKAAIAERFIRTLKERIWRYFTHHRTRRFLDVLPKIVQAYNNTVHSSIKMTPASVNLNNAALARKNLENRYKLPPSSSYNGRKKLKYKIGDLVRISRAKNAFAKGYEGGWTIEIFKIKHISEARQPSVYYVEDLAGEPIDGFFYEQELTRVRKNLDTAVFEVETILDTKGRGRNKKYLIHWRGYSDKFNSWEPAISIERQK